MYKRQTLRLEQPSDGTRETYGLSARGGLVLMADDMAALQVIDVADPRAPRKVGGFADLRYAQAVALGSTDRAVVEDWAGSAQLQVWDLLNPAAMRLVGASNQMCIRDSIYVDITLLNRRSSSQTMPA